MKAECTWGEGPDVILVGEGTPILLYHDPIEKERFTHGVCKEYSVDLTADEAYRLGIELINAARKAQELEKGWEEVMINTIKSNKNE
jgi:hypothetical protein